MLLRDIEASPRESLQNMERYVNDGSPSGFSQRYTTSTSTSPFGRGEEFSLYVGSVSAELAENLGDPAEISRISDSSLQAEIIVHPDMIDHPILHRHNIIVKPEEELKCIPTASGRSVHLTNIGLPYYLKLNYDGILGRVNRNLTRRHVMSGIEVSRIIERALVEGVLPVHLGLFRKVAGTVITLSDDGDDYQWGVAWREQKITSTLKSSPQYLIPAFSLFSEDRSNPLDPPLLQQILLLWNADEDIVLQRLLFPIVDSYFSLITTLGLQPEWNAQNLVFAFDKSFSLRLLVLRDLDSVDKDLTLREEFGLSTDFDSYPYKCISADQYNYHIKHSFMFDYKLGEYMLKPLIECASGIDTIDQGNLQKEISQRVNKWLRKLPANFLPEDCWYSFEQVLVDQSAPTRPYVKNGEPLFR